MEIFYWRSPGGNIGDDLNPWLWPKVFGNDVVSRRQGTTFFGIGSILDERVLAAAHPKGAIVFGAGMRGSMRPLPRREDVDIRFVRGPRSVAALSAMGWEDVHFISDPAILTPLFAPPSPEKVRGRTVFIPYFNTSQEVVDRICSETGLEPLPVTLDVDSFLERLRSAEKVVCEAMHGAILADAFRIPWASCRITSWTVEGPTSLFKWDDWRMSLGLDNRMVSTLPDAALTLPHRFLRRLSPIATARAVSTVKRLLRRDTWQLSQEHRLIAAQERMLDEAQRLLGDS